MSLFDSLENSRTIYGVMNLALSGRNARELVNQILSDLWHLNRLQHHTDLELEMQRKKPPELKFLALLQFAQEMTMLRYTIFTSIIQQPHSIAIAVEKTHRATSSIAEQHCRHGD